MPHFNFEIINIGFDFRIQCQKEALKIPNSTDQRGKPKYQDSGDLVGKTSVASIGELFKPFKEEGDDQKVIRKTGGEKNGLVLCQRI